MIEGGWTFVFGAYGVTFGGLGVLAAVVALRLRHWAKRAKALQL